MAEQLLDTEIVRWPTLRTWAAAGVGFLALMAGLSVLPDTVLVSTARQLLLILAGIGLLWQPEKRILLREVDDLVLVETTHRLRGPVRHLWRSNSTTVVGAPRESMAQVTPYELSWGDWWAAVRHGGRIERLGAYANLVGFKRRGIAIPVADGSNRLAMDYTTGFRRTVTTQRTLLWGLYEHESTHESLTVLPTTTFVFVLLDGAIEAKRAAELP